MDQAVKVAVVRGESRRGAVARALVLIEDDLRARVAPEVLVQPSLAAGRRGSGLATHSDTLSAALDALLASGARSATIVERAEGGRDRLGYHRECFGRPVRFLELDRGESDWEPIELWDQDGSPWTARLAGTSARASCRVSLATIKTHGRAMPACGLENLILSLHPADRARLVGVGFPARGNLLGRLRNAWSGAGVFLKRSDEAEALDRNLGVLSRRVGPHVSVVDGFVAVHREGPWYGLRPPLRTVIAGTDAVAVDAVSAAVLGFDPREIGYLSRAQEAGLGVADLDVIEVVGDPIAEVRRRCVPHSNMAERRETGDVLRGPITTYRDESAGIANRA